MLKKVIATVATVATAVVGLSSQVKASEGELLLEGFNAIYNGSSKVEYLEGYVKVLGHYGIELLELAREEKLDVNRAAEAIAALSDMERYAIKYCTISTEKECQKFIKKYATELNVRAEKLNQ